MSRVTPIPAKLAQRLADASKAEHEASVAYERARRQLARELHRASQRGYSVRALADATSMTPATTHRLIAHDTNGGKA